MLSFLTYCNVCFCFLFFFFFFNDPATTEIYTLSLHDALPIFRRSRPSPRLAQAEQETVASQTPFTDCEAVQQLRRSEEHTSELQSLTNLVCRLLLEKKKYTMECAIYLLDRLRNSMTTKTIKNY